MSISILKAGILDSFQDRGRYGHAAYGINPGGVMDKFAAQAANFLVGNDADEAVLELHFPASQLLFREDALIAVCGADLSPTIQDETIPEWQPLMIRKNTLLQFTKWNWGNRAYVAVHGGFNIPQWLNSYSTNLKASAGGYNGRALTKGDSIPLRKNSIVICDCIPADKDFRVLPWGINDRKVYEKPGQLLMLPGPEWELLDATSKQLLLNSDFVIDKRSDRMGSLLNGPALQLQQPMEMISSGVDFGTIQLLPALTAGQDGRQGGQLMILMADHQTTGGYPRLGNIITAHLPKLAQLHAGSTIRFSITDIDVAEQLLFSQVRDSHILQRSCRDHLTQLHAQH